MNAPVRERDAEGTRRTDNRSGAGGWIGAALVGGFCLGGHTSLWAQGEYSVGHIPVAEPRVAGSDLPYTIRKGDFRLLLTPSFGVEWNDNVAAVSDGEAADFILRPMLGIDASYPITRNNLLRLNLSVGYDIYLDETELSTFRLQTGSALDFDIVIKEFHVNLHDRVSLVRNSSRRGDVAGSAEQGNLENTVGISVRRDLGRAEMRVGFDHQDAMALEDVLKYQERSSELVSLGGGVRLRPDLVVGLEGTLSFTGYDLPVLNDNRGYSGGIYAEWLLGSAIRIQPRAGYAVYDFRQTSVVLPARDQNSWYADITWNHQFREAIGYAISAGHELRLGLQADAVTAWYVRPRINWQITERILVQPTFFWEQGNQTAGINFTGLEEDYDWYGAGLSVSGDVTSRLRASLSYRHTLRSSNLGFREYDQNTVSLQLTYGFR